MLKCKTDCSSLYIVTNKNIIEGLSNVIKVNS